MVIAIDGPAGAGKSTVARAAAAALGFTYLDTGAMYRAVAVAAASAPGASPADVAAGARIEVGERVLLDGRDVTDEIRSAETTRAASLIATDPGVRAALVAKQQKLIEQGDWVADGRDIALVVAPRAELKLFLTADEVERARRRAAQSGGAAEAVLAAQRERDARDATGQRSVSEPAPGAIALDTTELSFDEVVERVVALAAEASS